MNLTSRTALVTGASTGIGAVFARELAARGADLVLVARSADKLHALAAELEQAHGSKVHVLPLDLARPGAGGQLHRQVEELGVQVDLLVNNAGFGSYGEVAAADPDRLTELVQLNCLTLTDLTARFLPAMTARRSGAVVNVASVAGFVPLPRMAVYAASKAYVLSFTEALWAETRGTGVKVLAICPGATSTPFFEVAGAGESGPMRTPEQVVASTLAALAKGRPTVVDGLGNALLARLPGLMPRRLTLAVAGRFTSPR